jgi:single-strand DNA-binding protein
MSGSVNRVILVGRVGKDPEVKSFPNGGKIVSFSVATSERWNDKQSGEKKERTEWTNVVAQGDSLCRVVESHIRQGSHVYLSGKLQTRKWQDQSGQGRYATEVVLDQFRGEIVLLDALQRDAAPAKAKPRSFAEDLEDDVPFN